MEHSLSSLAFRGSVIEAITVAKHQKKLFVVYLSGDNPDSDHLETSTWINSNVAESVSKYCVLLHISEGSTDAANLSAIYPQKPAPCITAIGYNGLQVWQSEGFVTADFLASSLEKAWLSLQIQESTAAFLTAALASKKEPASGNSETASREQGSSSTTDEQSLPTDRPVHSTEAMIPKNLEAEKDNNKHVIEKRSSKTGDGASSESVFPDNSETSELDAFAATTETKESSSSGLVDMNKNEGECANPKESSDTCDHQTVVNNMGSQEIANESRNAMQMDIDQNVEVARAGISNSANKSTDIHLNIRMPDGSSLQGRFPMMDTLAKVKDYVDENRTSNFGSYDLAIPYPRKAFDDQDLNKQLSELGLSSRQALIVVVRHRANSHSRGVNSRNQTNANNHTGSASSSNEGYWAFAKRMLSYVNPLSYLGGTSSSSNSGQDTQSGIWQYGPNQSLQNDLRGAGSPNTDYLSNQRTAAASTSSNRKGTQQSSSRFGSNIHTLKHDEDDNRFSGRNAFWNGNSTQFGGDNDGK